jgi:hypothetical protein
MKFESLEQLDFAARHDHLLPTLAGVGSERKNEPLRTVKLFKISQDEWRLSPWLSSRG